MARAQRRLPRPDSRAIGDVARRYLVLDSPDVSAARTRAGSQLHQPGRAAAGIREAFVIARRTRSRRELFAYYPAVVFMPRVVDAITQAERARALLPSVAR